MVVRISEGRYHDLALWGVGVAAHAAATAAAEQHSTYAEVGVRAGALRCRNLYARAVVGQHQHSGRFVGANAAGNSAEHTQAAAKAAEATATAAGATGADQDFRRHAVVGRDHLAAAHVAAGAALARRGNGALALHVGEGAAALDHDEAVALLNHQAQHGHGGAQFVFGGEQAVPVGGCFFNQGDGAQRAGAFFKRSIGALGAVTCCRAGGGNVGFFRANRGNSSDAAAEQRSGCEG